MLCQVDCLVLEELVAAISLCISEDSLRICNASNIKKKYVLIVTLPPKYKSVTLTLHVGGLKNILHFT